MTGPVFVDTNVFVYLHSDSEPVKKLRADDWITNLVRRRAGRLSFQVLQELYSVLTRKLQPALPASRAKPIIRDLTSWKPLPMDLANLERAWFLQGRFSLSWWDALIVAAAQTSECKVLLTEDLQHGQVFDNVRVIDPFASAERTPAEIL
jgi:predicted nucleic acid-binding protein